MGRRRHERIYVGMHIRYQITIAESLKNPWMGMGILENVSHGGLYFKTMDMPPLEEGQIRDFTFTATEEHPIYPETDFIIAKGRVVHIGPREPGQQDIGIALEFFWAKFTGDFQDEFIRKLSHYALTQKMELRFSLNHKGTQKGFC